MNLIRTEAETRNPVHARRIQLLKVKKTSSHSDFLQRLEKSMEVCEWEKMSKDEYLLIHIFAESADQTMSKLAMEILSEQAELGEPHSRFKLSWILVPLSFFVTKIFD